MAEAKTLEWEMDTAVPGRADPDSALKEYLYWKTLEYELIPLSEAYPSGFERDSSKPSSTYDSALRVSPIPRGIDLAILEARFSDFGRVLDTRLFFNEGYAAVVFAVKHRARRAQQALNGRRLLGIEGIIYVDFAQIHRKPGESTFGVVRPAWTDHVPHNRLLRYLTGRAVQSNGTIQDENGAIVGRVYKGSVTGHYSCAVQSTNHCEDLLLMVAHRGDVVNARGELVARASLMPWKEKQLRRQGYGVSRSFRPEYDILIGRSLDSVGRVCDSDGKLLAYCNTLLYADNCEGMTVATDGEVLDAGGNLVQTMYMMEYDDTDLSGEGGDIDATISKTIKEEDEGQAKKTSKDKRKEEDEEQEEQEAPKPVFYTHYTISRDLTGSNDEVATKLLSALAERERSRENRFAKADLTLLAGRR